MKPVAMLVAIALSLAGCAGMRTLQRNLDVVHEHASLAGNAAIRGGASVPIVVVVEQVDSGRLADLFVLARPGPFFFTLPAGRYRLAAFEDRSRDLTYKAGKPAVLFGTSGEIVLQAGEHRSDIDLTIDPNAAVVIPFAVNAVSADNTIQKIPSLQTGTIVTLDDPRFAPEYGSLGVWDPLRFMFEAGGGVYFLEEYDPEKIPVLFVHGATGNPADWKYLVSKLDRRRFQPWFVYYPASPHLDRIGDQIVRALSSLEAKYKFEKLILVAHSMGGLVTRAALGYVVANAGTGRIVNVPAFVSISSPWGGMASASLGVEYAPVVAPMWEDMAPGSAFLTGLPETPLPAECDHNLFFGYRSEARRSKEANDGTVTVASQLSMPIQRQAAHVMGFDETHTSILTSAEASQQLNAVLDRVVQ